MGQDMAAPNPTRQASARQALDDLFRQSDFVYVIHYSCEDLDRPECTSSPRIAAIALRNLKSAQTQQFSILQTAEIQNLDSSEMFEHIDKLEKSMLKDFFEFISFYQGNQYLHWNMRGDTFGFQAIEHRYKVLCGGGKPYVVDNARKIDLSRLLIDIYGSNYIEHKRLERLANKNHVWPCGCLTGKQEAKAFSKGNFQAMQRSTSQKVQVLADIAELAYDRKLKTNTSAWDMRGGSLGKFLMWFGDHPIFTLVGVLAGVILAIVGIVM